MAKKKFKKKSKLLENNLSTREDFFYEEPNIVLNSKQYDLYKDYQVYQVILDNKLVIAYAGIFNNGKFNYSIKNETFDCHEAAIVRVICKQIRFKGLRPFLNPKLSIQQ